MTFTETFPLEGKDDHLPGFARRANLAPPRRGHGSTCRIASCAAFLFITLVGRPALLAQGSQVAIPCPTQPQGGTCPVQPTDDDIIEAKDYYDVSIVSVCVNYPDSFWKNKLISLQISLAAAGQAARSIPIYNDRAGSSCMIGANGFSLANSVPFDGNDLTLKTTMYRSDANDGLRKILSFANDTAQKSIFTSYAAAAIPLMSVVTNSINSALTTFGQNQTPWLTEEGMDFALAQSGRIQVNDLRQEFVVQYQGPSHIDNRSFYVDGFDLKWAGNGTLVRDPNSAFIIFQIRKRMARGNMKDSAWYKKWHTALIGVADGTVDGTKLTQAMQAASALLQNDLDYTSADQILLVNNIADATTQIKGLLSAQPVDRQSLRAAITAAEEPENDPSPAPHAPLVAGGGVATHTNAMIINPQRLAQTLRALIAPR